LPVALGAALACPFRKVVALEADGSAMYTLQALWTMARERLDVTVVILANRRYRILDIEMQRTGAGAVGPRAEEMIDLTDPEPDWIKLSRGSESRPCAPPPPTNSSANSAPPCRSAAPG
jgi:acetolactate synthase I/II/III large subunit